MVSAMTVYPGERNIFLREYRSAAKQSPMLFIFAYTVVEIPMELICSIIYTIIYMYGYGLQHGTRRYFELAVANFCVLNTGESIGVCINFCDIVSSSIVIANSSFWNDRCLFLVRFIVFIQIANTPFLLIIDICHVLKKAWIPNGGLSVALCSSIYGILGQISGISEHPV